MGANGRCKNSETISNMQHLIKGCRQRWPASTRMMAGLQANKASLARTGVMACVTRDYIPTNVKTDERSAELLNMRVRSAADRSEHGLGAAGRVMSLIMLGWARHICLWHASARYAIALSLLPTSSFDRAHLPALRTEVYIYCQALYARHRQIADQGVAANTLCCETVASQITVLSSLFELDNSTLSKVVPR